jgi:hypothetical protein
MAGLFTLNSESLGVLDEDVLGGLGTGYVEGQNSSSGAAIGIEGAAGVVAGANTSDGSINGVPGFSGAATGLQSSNGTNIGTPDIFGNADGAASSIGSAIGNPSVTGFCSGSSTSSGSATGSPFTPTPPEPKPSGKGGRYAPRFDYSKKPLRPVRRSGGVRGSSNSDGVVTGLCGFSGRSVGVSASVGGCGGVRWPSDELVAQWARIAARKKLENELLILEML